MLIEILAAWNLAVFLLYGYDKRCAKKGKWRVPERVLLGAAFLMGGIGAFAGMKAFHHKTLHKKFKYGVPFCILWNAAVLVYLGTKLNAFLWRF